MANSDPERRGNRVSVAIQTIKEVTRDTYFNIEGLTLGETLIATISNTGPSLYRVTFVSDGQERVKGGVFNMQVRVTRDGQELK